MTNIGVFDNKIKPSKIAKDIVEENFPKEYYGNILTYEAWPMRKIMENLIELGIQKYREENKEQENKEQEDGN